jgi:uncharacterized protein (DUF779 family)
MEGEYLPFHFSNMRNQLQIEKVACTEEASKLIEKLQLNWGNLMFHLSGGCCDGSQPMCFQLGEFRIGESDILLGYVEGQPFYMSKDQYEYWKHTHLTLDVVSGRGSSFSLEIPLGVRFIIKSRLFNQEELAKLNGS